MYVHVFSQVTRHHIQPLLTFFRDNVLPLSRGEEHIFVCCGPQTESKDDWTEGVNLVFANGFTEIRNLLLKHLRRKHHLIFHGLYDRTLVLALFAHLRRAHGATWIIWGSDLYPFLKPYPHLPHQIANMWLRRSVFSRMARIAGIPGDFAILAADMHANWHHSPINHPLRLQQEQYITLLEKGQARRSEELTVLIGNSDSATNRHEEALTELSRFRDQPMRLIMPLSYAGQRQYIDKVIQVARRLFDGKVTILEDVLTTEDYLDLLTSIDILVFNHHRQEGVGTINAALMLGKKVFLHHDVSTYSQLAASGVEVYDTAAISSLDFAEFGRWSADAGKRNHEAVYSVYGREAVAEQYRNLFRSIRNASDA